MILQSETYDGFDGAALWLLVAGGVAAGIWAIIALTVWASTRPRKPASGPVSSELHAETPALANFLTNGWKLTSISMTATLVDLAARGYLALEDYAGDRHVVRVRSNPPDASSLADYELQVLELVKNRATNGSAPVESLDLGEEKEASRWWSRFRKRVHGAARKQGLARSRWRSFDALLAGGGLLVVLEIFALAFGVAHVGDSNTSEGIDWFDWMAGALFGWAFVMGYFWRKDALRETPAGREACARWLGTRQFFRDSAAFGEATPGSVAAWERNLAYATAFGLAHTIDRALPMAPDDPETAWSRRGGEWHQVRISYPRRFGWGQAPYKVFFQGLGLTAFFGFIGFIVLPTIARGAWDFGQDILDDSETTLSPGAELGLVTGFVAVLSAFGLYILIQLTNGLIRLYRGGLDLGKAETIEGPVINLYQGRVAIDDGDDETCAWFPPLGKSTGGRGSVVRISRSPRLWHIRSLDIVDAVEGMAAESDEDESLADIAAIVTGGAFGMLTEADVSAAAGAAFSEVPATESGPLTRRFRSDSGQITISASPTGATKVLSLVGMFISIATRTDAVEPGDTKSTWAGGRVMMIQGDQHLVTIDVDLNQATADERKAIAERLAAAVMPTASIGEAS